MFTRRRLIALAAVSALLLAVAAAVALRRHADYARSQNIAASFRQAIESHTRELAKAMHPSVHEVRSPAGFVRHQGWADLGPWLMRPVVGPASRPGPEYEAEATLYFRRFESEPCTSRAEALQAPMMTDDEGKPYVFVLASHVHRFELQNGAWHWVECAPNQVGAFEQRRTEHFFAPRTPSCLDTTNIRSTVPPTYPGPQH